MSNDVPASNANNGGEIRIRYINSDGAGFADELIIPANMTIEQFVKQRVADPSQYRIRVNKAAVQAAYVIQPGDAVSVIPAKITGAR